MNTEDEIIRLLESDIGLENDLLKNYLKHYASIKDDFLRLEIRELMLIGKLQVKKADNILRYVKSAPIRQEAVQDKAKASLPEELAGIETGKSMIIELDLQSHGETIPELVKTLTTERGYSITYVSITKPVVHMKEIFTEAGANQTRINYVECSPGAEIESSINPSNLTQISIEIENQMQKNPEPKALMIDTLTALEVYNKRATTIEFVDVLAKKAKIKNFALLLLSLKSDAQKIDPLTQSFVDKTVTL